MRPPKRPSLKDHRFPHYAIDSAPTDLIPKPLRPLESKRGLQAWYLVNLSLGVSERYPYACLTSFPRNNSVAIGVRNLLGCSWSPVQIPSLWSIR